MARAVPLVDVSQDTRRQRAWHVCVGGTEKEQQPDRGSSGSEQQERRPCRAKQKAGRKEAANAGGRGMGGKERSGWRNQRETGRINQLISKPPKIRLRFGAVWAQLASHHHWRCFKSHFPCTIKYTYSAAPPSNLAPRCNLSNNSRFSSQPLPHCPVEVLSLQVWKWVPSPGQPKHRSVPALTA